MEFTLNLAAARVNRDMTQEVAAKELGISPSTLRSYECGYRRPNKAMLMLMSLVYDVPKEMLRT